MLLYQTVEQDGQRGEADVVQSQVGCIIERLGRRRRQQHLLTVCSGFCVCLFMCECLPAVRSHRRTGRGTAGK